MPAALRLAFFKLLGFALLGLFLLPVSTWWVSGHGLDRFTTELRTSLSASLSDTQDLSPADREGARAFVASVTAQGLCDGSLPQLQSLTQELCGTTGDVGQFVLARRIATATLWLGAFTLLLIAGLAGLAYARPRLQLAAFSAGWWSLRAISALEVLLQAAMLVWLSFWITALFF